MCSPKAIQDVDELFLQEVLLWVMDLYFSQKQWFEMKTS